MSRGEACGKFCGENLVDDCCCSCWRSICGCFTKKEGCASRKCPGLHFCCNKCCHSGEETVEEYYDKCKVNDHHRKCTDTGCCLLFVVWWIAWVVIAGIALNKGDPIELIYGQDYQGAQCGINDPNDQIAYPNHKWKKKIVYPRINDDLEEWATAYGIGEIGNIDWNTMGWDLLGNLNLTGVCVKNCPGYGEIICTDYYHAVKRGEMPNVTEVNRCRTRPEDQASNSFLCDNCWVTSLNTTDIFNRCLELVITNVDKTRKCFYPAGLDADDDDCITVEDTITSVALKPGYSSPFTEILGAAIQNIGQLVADTLNAMTVIWTCGIAVAFVFSFSYIVLLFWCAGPLVYLTLIGYFLTHTFMTLWLWMQSGYVDSGNMLGNSNPFQDKGDDIPLGNETLTYEQTDGLSTGETNDIYLGFAIVSTVLLIIGICIIASVVKEIRIAVRIIEETSKALMTMPTLLLYPIWSVLQLVLLVFYFLVVGVYLSTMEHVTTNQLAADVGFNATINEMVNTTFNSSLGGVGLVNWDTNLNSGLLWFHFFSFLWTANFINAIGICVIAGAVCQWYWILPGKDEKKKLPSRLPVISSVTRVYRFHLGSMAYGSAIIAVVQIIRAIMAYIDRKTKNIQEKHCIVRYLMKVVHCCLWFFEKCIKFVTTQGYIFVAMRGYSFCKATRNAFMLFLHNMTQFAVTHVVMHAFMLIGKVGITLSVAMCAYLWIEYDDKFEEGAEDELYIPMLPVVLAGTVGYFAATNFLNVYEVAISSILLCFCEDFKMHVQKPGRENMAFMSKSLRALVIGHGDVMKAAKVEAAIKKGALLSDFVEGKEGKEEEKEGLAGRINNIANLRP